jgi:hypothetical protein
MITFFLRITQPNTAQSSTRRIRQFYGNSRRKGGFPLHLAPQHYTHTWMVTMFCHGEAYICSCAATMNVAVLSLRVIRVCLVTYSGWETHSWIWKHTSIGRCTCPTILHEKQIICYQTCWLSLSHTHSYVFLRQSPGWFKTGKPMQWIDHFNYIYNM